LFDKTPENGWERTLTHASGVAALFSRPRRFDGDDRLFADFINDGELHAAVL